MTMALDMRLRSRNVVRGFVGETVALPRIVVLRDAVDGPSATDGRRQQGGCWTCFLFSAESRPRDTWGRSPGLWGGDDTSRRIQSCATSDVNQSLHLPRSVGPSGHRSDVPALTVAEPRRICTGLPCYAPRGHPRQTSLISFGRPAAQVRVFSENESHGGHRKRFLEEYFPPRFSVERFHFV